MCEVVKLLMVMPGEFRLFLRMNGCVERIVEHMSWAMECECVERTGGGGWERIVPSMGVVREIVEGDEEARRIVEDMLFPGLKERKGEEEEGGTNMEPLNAEPYTVGWKVIKCMTSVEGKLKRAARELAWAVTGGDPKKFVRGTGFGNAVHLLGIKGIVNTPKHDDGKDKGQKGQ